MNWRQRHLMAEAVFFLSGDKIVHAMRYDAFREHLLGGRALEQFASQSVRGVYAAIGDELDLRAACCFTLAFDERGIAASDWNVPLRELAHNSGAGPDLGMGETRLACRSQCSIPWHSSRLWGADLVELMPVLESVQKALSRNVLGIEAKAKVAERAAPVPPAASPARELQERAALSRTSELPAVAIARATKRFDRTFGERPRVAQEQVEAARSASKSKRAGEKPLSEMERMQAHHDREVALLKAEIVRLRKLVTAVAKA